MQDQNEMAKIHLHGRFQVVSTCGQPIEIKSLKSKALLVFLAYQTEGKASKAWILDLLWPGPNRAQAKASLRQELAKLRRLLRPHHIAISSDRHELGLEIAALAISRSAPQHVFLQNFPPVTPNFDNWVAAQRKMDAGPSNLLESAFVPRLKVSQWSVVIDNSSQDERAAWFAQLFGDAVATNVAEALTIPTKIDDGTTPHEGLHILRINIGMHTVENAAGQHVRLRIALSRQDTQQHLWAGHQTIASTGIPPIEDPKVESLIAQIVAALRHFLFRLRHDDILSTPDRLYEQALRDLFSMDAHRVRHADILLSQAYDHHPRGLYLATRAQIRAIQRVERFATNDTDLIEEAEAFLSYSLEDEPNNSMVLALASNTVGHLMRAPDRSLEFAGRSARVNPSNPMAWWSLSSANMYVGNVESSLRYASRGLQLAQNLQFRYWWNQQAFGAVFLLGRHEEALKLLKSVNAENPAYRPPLRYMLSLYAHFEMQEEFAATLAALRQIEPDFDLRRFHQDRDYPASLIHKSPGLNLDALRLHYD